MRHLVLIGAATLAAATVLSACSGGGMDDMDTAEATPSTSAASTSAPATGEAAADAATTDFNDADVTFAQDMIPHHRQASEMAALAADRAESQEVIDLAETIRAEQEPEIETMTGFLVAWGQAIPEDMSGMEGMDHGGTAMDEMPGMMSAEQMDSLEAATGADFDRLFLEMMIEHHEGAVQMAEVEQQDGQNAEAVALAGTIAENQSREIEEMQSLLGS